MELSSDLVSQFAKVVNDNKQTKKETTVYGTYVEHNGKKYVKLDGSDLLTPVSQTADAKPDERVTVMIKNHSAIVTGNISSPSARTEDVQDNTKKIGEFYAVVADKVSTKELEAEKARIDNLTAENVTIKETLTANKAEIDELTANDVTINETLTANKAAIDELSAKKLSADVADLKYATIEGLEATTATMNSLSSNYADFKVATADTLAANDASIKDLYAKKLSAEDAEITYANIDFSNIGKAAIEQFYATSGIIKDLVIGDQTVTGELVGVTIKGDLIEGGTVVADKLVVKGEDGLYYKLNTDGVTTEAEQTDYNSLNGSIITAKSITATKISVDDLVAFDATIGGFNITTNAIYSGVKESVNNSTRGIYLDNTGQMAIGDASNYIKYYRDTDGTYKLAISAKSITIGASSQNIEDAIDDIQTEMNTIKEEVTTNLRIESSRGTVFKNNNVSTVLNAVIYRGSNRITDMTTLKQELGNSAYLQWSWQKMNEEEFGTILSTDSRLSNDGFSLTLSPDDVDTKVTFMCQLITD